MPVCSSNEFQKKICGFLVSIFQLESKAQAFLLSQIHVCSQ